MRQDRYIDYFGRSERGQRETNEDQYLVATLQRSLLIEQSDLPLSDWSRRFSGQAGKLLVVADGMGGHENGELASSLAVYATAQYILDFLPWIIPNDDNEDRESIRQEFTHIIESVDHTVNFHGQGQKIKMGSTLTLAYVFWPRLYLVHVGDSRCYLMREQRLSQLTTDHTMAQKFSDQGVLDEDKARNSKWSHILWNALGGDDQGIKPEVGFFNLKPGDSLFLCTDGLSGVVPDSEIAATLQAEQEARKVCDRLIQRAIEEGSRDNITALACRFADKLPEESLDVTAATLTTGQKEPALVGS